MAAYDVTAAGYDKLYSAPEYLEENKRLFELINWQPGQSVLDVGCGTGLFWEYHNADGNAAVPFIYKGLDPSEKMLEVFAQKFPAAAPYLHAGRFEEYAGPGADLVVALYGVPNYIQPQSVANLIKFVNPGGRYFALFYNCRDYRKEVRSHREYKLEIKYWPDNVNLLPGQTAPFGPYLMVSGTAPNLPSKDVIRTGATPQTEPDNARVRTEPDNVPKLYRARGDRPGQRSRD